MAKETIKGKRRIKVMFDGDGKHAMNRSSEKQVKYEKEGISQKQRE